MLRGLRGQAIMTVGHEVEIAPVNAQVVTAFGEHGLFFRAQPQDGFAIHQEARLEHRLVGRVDDQFIGSFEVNLDTVWRAVGR